MYNCTLDTPHHRYNCTLDTPHHMYNCTLDTPHHRYNCTLDTPHHTYNCTLDTPHHRYNCTLDTPHHRYNCTLDTPYHTYNCRTSSFIRFVCGQESSLLWTPARRPPAGPVRLPRERGGELVGVCSVGAMCREGRLSRREQLVRYLLIAPRHGMAYYLTSLAGTYAATGQQHLCSSGPGGCLCSLARG